MTDTQNPTDEQPEGVRVIPVRAPFQFGATTMMRRGPIPSPVTGPDAPIVVILAQGGWSVQGQFNQNDALDFARRIQQAVKQARGGIQTVSAPLLGADGRVISTPADDELDELEAEAPDRENEATV